MSDSTVQIDGGCYCGKIRYSIHGKPAAKGQCHCRACQHFSGGSPNLFVLVNPDQFAYERGEVSSFTKESLEDPVTREFCPDCGTHMVTRRPDMDQLVVKIGTFDDPSVFKGPKFAIYTGQMQAFHLIPEGIPAFETIPNQSQPKK